MRTGLTPYRGLGLALAVSGSLAALYTYTLQGLSPLTAFWIGVVVVGLSILMTREEPVVKREVSGLLESSLATLSIVLELLDIRSGSVYRYIEDRGVYICIGLDAEKCPREPGVYRGPGGAALVVKSPFSYLVEDIEAGGPESLGDVLDHVAVGLLEIADSVSCVREVSRTICRFRGASAPTPGRLEKAVGDIYAILAATAAAYLYRGDVEIEVDERIGDSVVVSIRPLRGPE